MELTDYSWLVSNTNLNIAYSQRDLVLAIVDIQSVRPFSIRHHLPRLTTNSRPIRSRPFGEL